MRYAMDVTLCAHGIHCVALLQIFQGMRMASGLMYLVSNESRLDAGLETQLACRAALPPIPTAKQISAATCKTLNIGFEVATSTCPGPLPSAFGDLSDGFI